MNGRFKRYRGDFQVLNEDNIRKVIQEAKPNDRPDDDISVDLETRFLNKKPSGEKEEFANNLKDAVE